MNLSEPFVRRPVMTSLVMAGIFLFGVMAFRALPVSDLPEISFPTITVQAQNPGMNAQMMADNVATPLEQQLMTIDGLSTIVSESSSGMTNIVCGFDLSKSLDEASTDVSRAINQAAGNLPPQMPNPPTYQKTNPADTPVMYVAVTSESMTLGELYDYANNAIAQRLSMLPGVSQVQTYGSPTAVRVKVNPDKLAALQLGIDEVSNQVVSANQNLPSGTVYNKDISWTVNPLGQVMSGSQYDNVIVREQNGRPVYIRDIGQGVDSTSFEYYFFRYWTRESGVKPSVVVAVTKQSGANTVKLCNQIRTMLPTIGAAIPSSINLEVMYDGSISIKESVSDVETTLIIAFVLVVMVIFLFLGNLSSTIIPSITLPMSIIGTFAFMLVNNYSIDILSMLALTLIVGFLVDDAIVVLENIVRHMDMGKTPFQAALDGSKQISTTVLSMSLALSSVFIPIIFMPGIIGRLFHEFGMVIVIAVLLSGFISLTLTPMLCSLFLKPSRGTSRLEERAKKVVESLLNIYKPALMWVLRNKWVPIAASAASLALALYFFTLIPQDFLPAGDKGAVQGLTIASQDVSLWAMADLQTELGEIIKNNAAVKNFISVANFGQVVPQNWGILFLTLDDINKRPPIDKVVAELNQALAEVVGIRAFLTPVPEINLNVGTTIQRADYTYSLSTLGDAKTLYAAAEALTEKIRQSALFSDVSNDIQNQSPMLNVTMLRDQASTYGITVQDIENAFSLGYGGGRVSTFNTPLNIYNIVVEMEDDMRLDPSALDKIWLKSNSSQKMVPLSNVARWDRVAGPLSVMHSNQFTAANIYFNLAPGAALSQAVSEVEKLADETLDETVIRAFQGTADIFKKTMGSMGILLAIGVLVIYLLLGSLYESYIHPLTILSTLPGALFGGLLTLLIFNATLSLYAYVGMIVLIGIVMKNGIMLVEFANELVEEGKSAHDAIVEASLVRFRPILMTTVAAAMGAVPVALGLGADAATRRPLGLVILGGLIFAQFITYFFTPVVYTLMQSARKTA
ncbi:MAG: efflux RND transporter permease subunit [Chlamydiia bacterium]|nr:efflux RND transporter permease subunit [Chlamydiia bacterium]